MTAEIFELGSFVVTATINCYIMQHGRKSAIALLFVLALCTPWMHAAGLRDVPSPRAAAQHYRRLGQTGEPCIATGMFMLVRHTRINSDTPRSLASQMNCAGLAEGHAALPADAAVGASGSVPEQEQSGAEEAVTAATAGGKELGSDLEEAADVDYDPIAYSASASDADHSGTAGSETSGSDSSGAGAGQDADSTADLADVVPERATDSGDEGLMDEAAAMAGAGSTGLSRAAGQDTGGGKRSTGDSSSVDSTAGKGSSSLLSDADAAAVEDGDGSRPEAGAADSTDLDTGAGGGGGDNSTGGGNDSNAEAAEAELSSSTSNTTAEGAAGGDGSAAAQPDTSSMRAADDDTEAGIDAGDAALGARNAGGSEAAAETPADTVVDQASAKAKSSVGKFSGKSSSSGRNSSSDTASSDSSEPAPAAGEDSLGAGNSDSSGAPAASGKAAMGQIEEFDDDKGTAGESVCAHTDVLSMQTFESSPQLSNCAWALHVGVPSTWGVGVHVWHARTTCMCLQAAHLRQSRRLQNCSRAVSQPPAQVARPAAKRSARSRQRLLKQPLRRQQRHSQQ